MNNQILIGNDGNKYIAKEGGIYGDPAIGENIIPGDKIMVKQDGIIKQTEVVSVASKTIKLDLKDHSKKGPDPKKSVYRQKQIRNTETGEEVRGDIWFLLLPLEVQDSDTEEEQEEPELQEEQELQEEKISQIETDIQKIIKGQQKIMLYLYYITLCLILMCSPIIIFIVWLIYSNTDNRVELLQLELKQLELM